MHSPYWDEQLGRYPVGRLQSVAGIPLEAPKPPAKKKKLFGR
jgi:hypothetical protein